MVLQKLSFYFFIKLGAVYDRRMIFGGVHVDGDLISARNLPGIMLHGVYQLFPCLFFWLGTGTGIPLHASTFNFDESVLIEGVKLFNTIFTEFDDFNAAPIEEPAV